MKNLLRKINKSKTSKPPMLFIVRFKTKKHIDTCSPIYHNEERLL